MWPEPYATIAREREKGTPTAEVAKMFNVHANTVRSWVREWNRENPDNPVPRQTKINTAVYVRAAEMKLQGLTRAEVARRMGMSESRIINLWSHARARGLLPRIIPKVAQGGQAAYKAYWRKGAVPRQGHLGDVLDELDTKQIDRLVNIIDPRHDKTLADTVARIVKEHLRDTSQGR